MRVYPPAQHVHNAMYTFVNLYPIAPRVAAISLCSRTTENDGRRRTRRSAQTILRVTIAARQIELSAANSPSFQG